MFKIIICSYNRLELLKTKTLNFIKNNFKSNVPVYIFTPQYDDYFNEFIEDDQIKIILTKKGLSNARNHVIDYFEEDEQLLFLDDDIDDIIKYDPAIKIDNEFKRSFKLMEKNKIKLGSINPTSNKYFSNGDYKYGLYFCIGCCYMLINDKQILDIKDELEDYERSIVYYKKYQSNFRNDRLFIKTKYNQKGGMYSVARNTNRTKRAIELFCIYPNYVLLKLKKEYLGIRLKWNTKNQTINLQMGGGLMSRDMLNGSYPNIKLDKNKLKLNTNYIFRLQGKLIGYLIRQIYSIKDFKITMKNNQNSGDISGKIEKEKLGKCFQKYYDEYDFNKQKTRTAKSKKHKFELCNSIQRLSKEIKKNDVMNRIYEDVKDYNIFGTCNYFTCNKDLQSAYHRDRRNRTPYVMLLTLNNKLNLSIPELNIEINNRDTDLLVFDLKNWFHANTAGETKDRYSIVFFDKKIKGE